MSTVCLSSDTCLDVQIAESLKLLHEAVQTRFLKGVHLVSANTEAASSAGLCCLGKCWLG